jgi:hypothetical protein
MFETKEFYRAQVSADLANLQKAHARIAALRVEIANLEIDIAIWNDAIETNELAVIEGRYQH